MVSMVSCSKASLRISESDDAPPNYPNPSRRDCITTLFAMPHPIWAKSSFMHKTYFSYNLDSSTKCASPGAWERLEA